MTFSISAKIQDGSQNLVPKINAFLQKFKMAAKNGSKAIFVKWRQYNLSKSLYLEQFTQKFKMATKNGGKVIFVKSCQLVDPADNLQFRNFIKITLSRTVSQINLFCNLRRNSRWPLNNGGKVIFAKCCQYTLQIPCGSIILSKSLYLAPFPR